MPALAVERPRGVLDVHVVDPVGEGPDELDRVDELPEQVAGVEVEAELGPVVERLQGHLGRVDVEGDLGRVDLQAELDAALLEDVEDRVPALGQELEAGVDHRVGDRRERVEQVPDRRAGEAVDDLDAQLLRGAGRVLHLLGGPLADLLGLAVAPDVVGQDQLVPLVDQVADRLADQVVRDRPDFQLVLASSS